MDHTSSGNSITGDPVGDQWGLLTICQCICWRQWLTAPFDVSTLQRRRSSGCRRLCRWGPCAPRWYDPTLPAGGSMQGRALAFTSRPLGWHSLAHLFAERSDRYGSSRRGLGWTWTLGRLVKSPAVISPLQAGLANCAAAGRRPDRLGRGQGRSVKAYLSVKQRGENC